MNNPAIPNIKCVPLYISSLTGVPQLGWKDVSDEAASKYTKGSFSTSGPLEGILGMYKSYSLHS